MLNIYFVHGFGVRADGRGMFPDIEKYLSNVIDAKFIYADLSDTHINSFDTIVLPFSEQVERMNSIIERGGKGRNILIAHSQGCVISTLLSSKLSFDFAIFLAPPSSIDFDNMIERMKKRAGSNINKNAESIILRSDGTKTYIPKEYFSEKSKFDYNELYKDFCSRVPTYIIQAQEDDVLDNTGISLEEYVQTYKISGNHDFNNSSQSRKGLLELIYTVLTNKIGKS